MTQPGRGGQQPAPINSAAGQATVVGTQPGVTGGIVRARQVIISGSADGVFVYDGSPGAGTLVGSWAADAGTDPYGNAYPKGFSVGLASGTQTQLIPSDAGGAAEISFPFSSPALSNTPNIGAGPDGAFAELVISGPALAAAGEKDWCQVVIFSNDTLGDEANIGFRYIDTLGNVTVVAEMQGTQWTFTQGLIIDGTLSSSGGNFGVDGSGNITCGPDVNLTPPMGAIVNYPLSTSVPTDTNSGTTWVSGERAFMNNNWVAAINNISAALNNLIGEMINRGFIS